MFTGPIDSNFGFKVEGPLVEISMKVTRFTKWFIYIINCDFSVSPSIVPYILKEM